PSIFTFRHIRSDNVPILEPLDPLGRLLELQNNDAAAVDLAAEAGSPAHRLGVQTAASGQVPIATIRHRSNAQGIVVVVFWQPQLDTVELGPAARCTLDLAELLEQAGLNIPAAGVCPGAVAAGNQRSIAGFNPLDALEPCFRQPLSGGRAF